MPNLIYVSREKSKTSSHNFKAGALNVLLRVSATMTNAPIILNLDCDMYSNDPRTPLRALCYLLDPKLMSQLAYVQFPQIFHGINKNDTYSCEYKRIFCCNPLGLDGMLGPSYVGTGCFFNRRAFFGSPSAIVPPEIPELGPDNVVDKFIQSQPILELAHKVAGCNYEYKTKWGYELSEPSFILYVFLVLGAYGQDLLEFLIGEGTVQKWWNDQRMWMIRGLSAFGYGCLEFFLKCLGISTYGFSLTSKVIDDEQSKRYGQGMFEFGASSNMFVPLIMAAIINLVSFLMGLVQVLRGRKMEGLFLQIFLAGFVVLNALPIYEAMVLRNDEGRIPFKTTTTSACLALALYGLVSLPLGNQTILALI
ncbi:hypothetical protein F2P56_004646 [Juglans regia]|uniref:Cellulose synthase-like protein G3 n=1 Tax=Juglans regia TaxID=51240 RepID=A0A834D8C1_JUGRE|nr:hypothetical protein F2P56_004646 [Juglans regia]